MVGKEKQKAMTLMQKLVRMKASDDAGFCQCVTCGVVKHYKEMDGGHYISRKYNATCLMEENIHPQCKGCNGFKNGNMDAYALYMLDMYGREFLDELNQLKHSVRKFTTAELKEIQADLRKQIKDQEARIG